MILDKKQLLHLSPAKRAWLRFKNNRRGYYSLWIFSILLFVSLFAEMISNDKPLIIHYEQQYYYPLWNDYPETIFGGDFAAKTDYNDPYIKQKIEQNDNWAIYPLNHYRYDSINYFADLPNPAQPSTQNYLGTDDRGRDVLARLIYGFRLSVLFALFLTAIGIVIGIIVGSIQGYFVGKIDLVTQRFIEIWSSMPELYLLIIFASIFNPSIGLLIVLLSLFGWMGLSDYVRAEFLRTRNLDYVMAARSMGVSDTGIMFKHLLPNSMVPVLTFLPFRISGSILALTSLDYLGLGVPPSTPSLGELLSQGKENIDAWWLSMTTFSVLVGTLVLLIFIGEALREALDTRRG
ncbi:MAG: ABC transporter permease [gamma proteobacterium symbiont of Taylorina sp.]|nr:ABC transporter permease [gamma proteobacterium symbiont of Taylorina sp.]